MQRAFMVGIFLGALLACLGVFVVLRRMAFFSDGIAHASLAGIAAGVLAGVNPLIPALVVSVFFAIGMYVMEKKARLATDTVIGIIFTSGMALGVLLMSRKAGYQPELIGFLFGNILAIRSSELPLIIVLGAAIGLFLVLKWREIILVAVDREMAYLAGVKSERIQLLMYVVLAVAVVLGIKILGVVLVSALLVIPVSVAKLISGSFQKLVLWSIVVSELIVIAGLTLAYFLDLPAGAVIVLCGSFLFFATLLFKGFRSPVK